MKKYLVGGAVRDKILKLPIKEKDWVIVGSTPEKMITAGFQQVGKDFPVFLHPHSHEEYALARTEKKSGLGYKGFTCLSSSKITLEEDLLRRDLTINAIAIDDNNNYIDPYNGIKDIKNRILRHVSNSFQEDPLRVLRVARLAAYLSNFNFTIDPKTMILMKKMNKELYTISPDRIWKETKKTLLNCNPHIYFKTLYICGALKTIFPEIDKLFKINYKKKNKNNNVGEHTLLTLSISAQLSSDPTIRFSALCHDLGKQKIASNKNKKKNNHNILGKYIIHKMCKRLHIPNIFRDIAKIVSEYHHTMHKINTSSPKKIINLLNSIDVWRKPENLKKVIISSKADFKAKNKNKNIFYSQEFFIKKAYRICNTITPASIINDGFTHKKIKQELENRRQHILSLWIKNK